MATIYINLCEHLNSNLSLPPGLYANGYQIECLKCATPDDGEALRGRGKYRVECPDGEWRDVLEILKESGKGLVYSVVTETATGEPMILEAGEMNSTVQHYSTRLRNARQLFSLWFEDELPEQTLRFAS